MLTRSRSLVRRAAGAPTSFQPDCHEPSLTMLSAMFRKASASSWRARTSGPTSIGRRPIERTSSRTVGLRRGVVARDVAIELDALGDRVDLVGGEQRVERLDDRAPRQQLGERLRVRRRRVDLRPIRAERDAIRDVDDGLARRLRPRSPPRPRRRPRTGRPGSRRRASAAASAFVCGDAAPRTRPRRSRHPPDRAS